MQAQLTQDQYDRIWEVVIGKQPVASLQTPDELHQFAWNYNWDNGLEAMRQVIDHRLSRAERA